MAMVILTSDEGRYGIDATIEALQAGCSGLDAMEAGIKKIEDDHRARTVAFGGAPNILGVMECDASVMRGDNRMVGAVGALRGCRYPFSAARRVMETLPHVSLAGEGASRFAREMGIESSDLLSAEAVSAYQEWLANNLNSQERAAFPEIPLAPLISFQTRSDLSRGTVTFLVRDGQGNLFGGVSTSGWAYKYPGRLGDSPVIGAGMYVDNRYGGAACTHTGEMTIRAGTARSVVLYMKSGAGVKDACYEAMQDLLELRGGYLGPVIIHAIDRHGETFVGSTGGDEGDSFLVWRNGMELAKESAPTVITRA
jgi:beta-aspartyl-peptidase (threonine type)